MVFISPPPLLHHCTGLESANCLLEYIATISFYGKPTPKMICLNYKLQARRSGSSHTNLQNHVAKNGNPPPPIIRCEWAPGNEQHHHPSQGVVEGPPRQAGHAGHLQHHEVSTVLSSSEYAWSFSWIVWPWPPRDGRACWWRWAPGCTSAGGSQRCSAWGGTSTPAIWIFSSCKYRI